MDISHIKPLLIEHSNAARCVHRAMRIRGDEQKKLLTTAVEHLKMVRQAQSDIPADSVPVGLDDKVKIAIDSLERADIEKGWEIILEIGRMFDEFRRQ